jgi:putative selenate reductase
VPDVYIAGDCRAGAATVGKAIADGQTAAADILRKLGLPVDFEAATPVCTLAGVPAENVASAAAMEREKNLYAKRGVLIPARAGVTGGGAADSAGNTGSNGNTGDAAADSGRCLSCAEICEICVEVCPNRANAPILTGEGAAGQGPGGTVKVPPPARQVLHIDRLCNECGNCAVFCPHGGKPYRDKFTVFARGEDFADSDNPGFFRAGTGHFRLRLEDKSVIDWTVGKDGAPTVYAGLINTIMEKYPYLV